MKDVKIRAYRDVDYTICRALWTELTQHHRMIYDDPTIGGSDPGAGLDTYLAIPKRIGTWVAESDGVIIGMTGLIAGTWQGEGEIEPVVVTANCRLQGIGTQLVQRDLVEARKAGIHSLSVRPAARNKSAILFFVKSGFNTAGYVDLYQDLDAVRERKRHSGIMVHGIELKY